jgi:hypothetical protein
MKHVLLPALIVLASMGGALAWGSIAVDDDDNDDPDDIGYGLISGYAIKSEAVKDALAACKDEGNDNCHTVLTFPKCGAYAASPTDFGVGAATTLRESESRALASCGGASCKIVVSDCD